MAVTKRNGILLAALALPGVAAADNPPEQASLSIKYLDYKESQHNLDRISVHSPSFELLLPIAGSWSLRAGMVSDAISGASPRYHTAVTGASRFSEKRTATDLEVTQYGARSSISIAAGHSGEHDYVSNYASARASFSSENNNTTWQLGAGVANDRINPVNLIVQDERKHTNDFLLGVTQVMTPQDVAQVVLTHAHGNGYFTMPYKYVDQRPRTHNTSTALLRWNHYFSGSGGSLRSSYRYYTDNWGIDAHALQAEYAQPLPGGWTVTPLLRYAIQSAASFYFDPVYDKNFGPPFPPGYDFASTAPISADQRLSSFEATTLGLKIEKQVGKDSSVDLKFEQYGQRTPGLANFWARSIVLGYTTRW